MNTCVRTTSLQVVLTVLVTCPCLGTESEEAVVQGMCLYFWSLEDCSIAKNSSFEMQSESISSCPEALRGVLFLWTQTVSRADLFNCYT